MDRLLRLTTTQQTMTTRVLTMPCQTVTPCSVMEADDTRAAIGASVRRAIQDSGKSVDEVARLFGVKRQTVYQWQGGGIPMSRLAPLAEKIGQPIVIRIGQDDKANWPEWARQIDGKMDSIMAVVGAGDPITDALHEARRTVEGPAPDEDPPPVRRRRPAGPG